MSHHRHATSCLFLLSSLLELASCFNWDQLLSTKTSANVAFADLPRFKYMIDYHRKRSQELYGNDCTPNLLQGGSSAGPLARRSSGQVVRSLGTFPGLSASPRYYRNNSGSWPDFAYDDLKWVDELESRLDEIKMEFESSAIPDEMWETFRTKKGQEFSATTGWSHVSFLDNFKWKPKQIATLPRTYDIVTDIVGTERRLGPRHIAVARQKSGTGIPEHSDLINTMLTLHMVIKAPSKCAVGITINGEKHFWKVGDPIVFDTTYPHETFNEGEGDEDDVVVLLVDFWHPDLSICEIEAVRKFWRMNSGV
ncbi:hypothetical protein TrLO_g11577 [Triparma laevis f. longispina]|uniref:Aspartyl/asparaginy/proline hydroxylase domain-containing protein n=1 Tax=Triparma laevis f. longispina TaxID=1714387 RepID=A0A9W7CLD5_9STRA|nr:hypothetical protein TrLO_g11577 [Triparma laevis f. longispina]